MNKEQRAADIAQKVLDFHATFLPPDGSESDEDLHEEIGKCIITQEIITRKHRQGIISDDEYLLAYEFINTYASGLYRANYERLKIENL